MEEPFHSGEIPGGSDWRRELTTSLDQCEAIIFCFTPEATTSGWVLYEAGYMAAKRAATRPFVYGATVPEPLRNLQAVELSRETVSELIDKLAELADLIATRGGFIPGAV
jgi:nucleoside 2-deoxyribosyltransferase